MDSFRQQLADTSYKWDLDVKASFPEITGGYIATRQANDGFSNDGESSPTADVQRYQRQDAKELLQRKTPNPLIPKGER